MSSPPRTLLVLRHSKSAYPEGVADIDRPLAPRGVRNAVTLGGWLLGQGLLPDLVVCSTAARTRQTWDLISDQLVWPGEDARVVRYDPRVYDADPADLLAIVGETPPEAAIVALVGHNPGAAQLVLTLTGETGLSFPTSALAIIEIRQDWDGAAPGSGSLAGYWTPKGGSAARRE
ncbi:MAG: SixA phosphatase family protein [Streptosporangiaceae bacterium]